MLQAKNICITLIKDQRVLIDHFSWSLQPDDKVVIIGEEGNGKSTLLKLLYDESLVSDYISYTGEIIRKGKFGYLPQFMREEDLDKSVADYFTGVDIYSSYTLMERLNLDDELIHSDRIIRTLSGGEKVKVQLLKLLCETPDALLLDEPSNDLDIETLTYLEEFIKHCRIPVVYYPMTRH